MRLDLRVGTFQCDVTPPIGSPLCDGLVKPAKEITAPLTARGIIFKADEQKPVVLVAVDWVGIGNEGHDAWREALAKAAGTSFDRVSVHSLHQHDAPGCDFLAERIAAENGIGGEEFNVKFAREAIQRVATAAGEGAKTLEPVTEVGYGMGQIEQVASNRRVLGPDGKVQVWRATATGDAKARAMPEGTIDPMVRLLAFFHDKRPVAVVSYYATHPQSYYGAGYVNPDYIGMARDLAQVAEGAGRHIHFNGAGGNVGAGKYNDGNHWNRPVLALRVFEGMHKAWDAMKKVPVGELSFDWATRNVELPLTESFNEAEATAAMHDEKELMMHRIRGARQIAWARRVKSGHKITIGRLRLGGIDKSGAGSGDPRTTSIDILHMPGELFVEYQLAAQKMAPDRFVCMAAYGDYGTGYIGTAIAYDQGGYETGVVSRVSPRVEAVLMGAIQQLVE